MDQSNQARKTAHRCDDAVDYLETHTERVGVDLITLRRKIDCRVLPYMFCCYVLQFLDKVMLNYAAIMGLEKDLKLTGNEFSNTATWFFIAYLIAEVPNVYCLQKFPAAKWLGGNVFFWGVAAAASAGAHDYQTLLVARVFLGAFEATVGSSLMLLSSQYYTRSEQAPRFTFWYMGMGVAQILGGIISFAFQPVHNAAVDGWCIMFLILGLITSVVGALTFSFIPDTPLKASWLTDDEKTALLQHVSHNQTGLCSSKLNLEQIQEAVMDMQLWLLVITTILISVSSGVITTYSATLIAGFGFSSPISALLNTPSGIVSIFFTLLVGFGIRRTSNRWAWNVLCTIPGISNKAGVLIGVYLVNAIVATLPILYQWTMANCAGHTKRAFASAHLAGSFSMGNIIGPQTFQARDAPSYHPAKIIVLATQAAAAAVTVVLYLYYRWANRRRDQKQGPVNETLINEIKWAGLTDKKNTCFRYAY
ncbi:hypothetical protein N7451_000041 [Penicillium sp. IBT 35674x]|nr:hypothetical protein N7451_000041 [Penicillium sp. IBT 35674x]